MKDKQNNQPDPKRSPENPPNFQGLVEAANSIILSMSKEGIITYINPFGIEFFGFDPQEIIGYTPSETIAPKEFSGDSNAQSIRAIVENPRSYANHTNENLKKDGSRVWISWSNKGIYDSQGELREILCVGNDITRMKQMEVELHSHRDNLENLVEEKTRDLSMATQNLVDSQNHLMVLNTISTCIIRDKNIDVIINQVLEKLTSIFTGCGAAYIEVLPGASLLTVDHACSGPSLPDLKGTVIDVAEARPLFRDLAQRFTPYVFKDTQKAAGHKGLGKFVRETHIRSGLVTPLHHRDRLLGLIFLYSLEPRQWADEESALMEQVSASLAVGMDHSKKRDLIISQEQFLENIFDGVDIGILVLKVTSTGQVMIDNINERYREQRNIGQRRVSGLSIEGMEGFMDAESVKMIKDHVVRCIEARSSVKFLEQTLENEEKKYWLTRLNPVVNEAGQVFRIIGASTDISDQKEIEDALITNEARLKEAQRIAKLGDCERDIQTRSLSCSDQLSRIFGWEENICHGYEAFETIVHPEDREYVKLVLDKAIAGKAPYDMEYRIIRADGEERILNEIGEPIEEEPASTWKLAGIIQDVSEQKKFKDEIELARKVFDNAVEGVVVTGRDGTIQFVNKGFTNITGYTEEEAVGMNPRLLKSDRHDRSFYNEMWEALDREGHWSGEIWNRRKSGEAYPEWLSITAITNQRGEAVRYMSVFNDLSDLREREEQLRFQANYDALTGLPNRTLLQDRIYMSIRRVSRGEHGLAVIFLDMDDFKHVNDTLGHAKGDLLLQQFATRVLESVREQDTVARYGGDEFVVLIPDTNEAKIITQIIERIRTSLQQSFVVDGKEFFLGVSIGVTICPNDGMEPDVLIANADMAMYRSKEVGKGGYAFFTSELNQEVARRVELEMDLRMGISRQEFSLYFQPKINTQTQEVCGAEALVRWNHPEKGLISPAEFIPLAEETGLINPLGEWILDQACARAKAWSRILDRHFRIAVNISFRQVKDVDLPTLVAQTLERHQLPADCLELEITESAVMGNVEKAKKMFTALDDMGIRISLDDFGTGFSSLSYLRLFPISSLKIDKSFVDDIPGDADSSTMVTTIITMARHLNLITVAEGVEDKSQLEFLKKNQCNQIQGYYFAPPMPADEFLEFVRQPE